MEESRVYVQQRYGWKEIDWKQLPFKKRPNFRICSNKPNLKLVFSVTPRKVRKNPRKRISYS